MPFYGVCNQTPMPAYSSQAQAAFLSAQQPSMPSPSVGDYSPLAWEPQSGTSGQLPQPASASTQGETGQDHSLPLPKKRTIQAHVSKEIMTDEEFALRKASMQPPTFRFQNLFGSAQAASQEMERLLELYRKTPEDCTDPMTDSTFPRCTRSKIAAVKQVFYAINSYMSLIQTPDAEQGDEAVNGHPISRFVDHGLQTVQTSRVPRKKKNTSGRDSVPSDQAVEWISWGLVVSWSSFSPDPRPTKPSWQNE